MEEILERKVGNSAQECIDKGLPDKDNNYYFEALITNSIYCSPDKFKACTYFNICEFETQTPLPNLKYDNKTMKNYGKLVGNTIELQQMSRYKIKASMQYNEKYNEWQYQIKNVLELETRKSDILNSYLKFFVTDNTYNIIRNNDENFIQKVLDDNNFVGERFKGMQQRTYDKILKQLREYRDYIPLISKLGQFDGITLKTIEAINGIASNPKQALNMVEDNPYILTSLNRFGWKKVDKIAQAINPELLASTQRLICYCVYALEEIANSSDGGHTWIFINNPLDIKHSMAHLMRDNIPECQSVIKNYFESERLLTKANGCGTKFYVDKEKIGLAKYYNSEKSILNHLNRINNGQHLQSTISLEDAIKNTDDWMSNKVGEEVHLTDEQKDAIKSTLTNDVVILTANAGAGKSTTIKGMIELWKDKSIACCALSAKAAIRIQEVSGEQAFTIHRLLEFGLMGFARNENNKLDKDIIIVDECSMINVSLFLCLLKAIPSSSKLILVFDDAQLPAIGAGSVAKDLLQSDFCIKRLTKIHRQAAKSGIKIDANKIRKQQDVFSNDYDCDNRLPLETVHGEKNDMHYFNIATRVGIHQQTIDIYKKLISNMQNAVEDITIIVPMKSNAENCTDTFNQEIQEILLPTEEQYILSGRYSDKNSTARKFKKGCRVIRRKNDYDKQVFNGEMGTLFEISKDFKSFSIKFDDGRVQSFESKDLMFFDLAYALTVHSMQGSENKIIIFVMDSRHNILLDSTLFYTAITRAKKENYVIFQPSAYKTAFTTDKVCARQTFLPILISKEKENKN